jgi:glycosyltransferase involved in cell wall biosynthesis
MGGWGWGSVSRFFAVLDERRPDLVHFQYPSRGYGWNLAPVLLPLLLAIREPGMPQVVTLHEFEGSNPLRRAAYLFFTLFARAVVAPSRAVRRGLESLFPWVRGKTTVIPVGTFLPAPDRRFRPPPGRPLLVFPGFLLSRKGPREALEAAALLRSSFPRLRLLFASDGDSHAPEARRLRARVRALGLEDNVSFTGRLEPASLAGALSRADLVLLPFHDGASTRRSTLASALSLRRPVATTEGADLLEEFRRGGVLLCRPRDARSLAGAVHAFLTDASVRRRVGSRLPHLAALFDWRRIASAHLALYGEVRGGGR